MDLYFNNLSEWLDVYDVSDFNTSSDGSIYFLIDGSMYVLGYNVETDTYTNTPVKLTSFTENIQNMDILYADEGSLVSFIDYGSSESETVQPKVYVKVEDSYKQISNIFVKSDDVYIRVKYVYVKTINGWKAVH